MIKGVNRRMIELKDLHSNYFDRAFVILKESCCEPDEETLEREAKLTITNTPPDFIKNRRQKFSLQLWCAAAAGAFISSLFITLIYLFV